MFNMADLVLYVPPGGKCWPSSIHESFVPGFVSSLIPHMPWQLRGAPKVMGLGSKVSFMIWESTGDSGSALRQLRLLPKSVASISGVLEWGLLLS